MTIEYTHHEPPFSEAIIASVRELLMACFGQVSPDFAARMHSQPSASLMLARSDQTAVGFKLSYARSLSECYSWLGGVHPDYRQRGIARALMRQQHAWARAAGYQFVTTETENRFRAMLILNLREGFEAFERDKTVPKVSVDRRGRYTFR